MTAAARLGNVFFANRGIAAGALTSRFLHNRCTAHWHTVDRERRNKSCSVLETNVFESVLPDSNPHSLFMLGSGFK